MRTCFFSIVSLSLAECVTLFPSHSWVTHGQGKASIVLFLLSPQVVANAVAALSEIAEASPHLQVMDMNSSTINKLLTALNECTEWGQVFILDCLSSYTPKGDREAQSTCERVTPRLAHANAAVVLSAVKVNFRSFAFNL